MLWWWLRRRRRVRVTGASMLPILAEGDEVLVDPRRRPRIGRVAVARHPFRADTHLVKRVAEVDGDGRYVLLGDNPGESTDSRTLGPFPAALILGEVTSRLP